MKTWPKEERKTITPGAGNMTLTAGGGRTRTDLGSIGLASDQPSSLSLRGIRLRQDGLAPLESRHKAGGSG